VINFAGLVATADAVLYEGYLLYPYHAGALKNQRRWTFGCLLPDAWAAALGEPSWMQSECLVEGSPGARLAVRWRFLHQDADEVVVAQIDTAPIALDELLTEPLQQRRSLADGAVEAASSVSVCEAGGGVYRVQVRLANATIPDDPCSPTRDAALRRSLLSCHALLGVEGGCFVSSIDPPPRHQAAVAACRNVGLWLVLAGDPAQPALALAASIILYDFPQVARESPLEAFDATEIDELLRLRLLTLTEEEQTQVRADGRARRLLEQAGDLSETDTLALHGAWRVGLRPGDRVRLCPARRADLFDCALAGRAAVVVSVNADLEGRLHVGVVIDDDPGRDLGLAGWPGHRFYFSADEVEVLQ
jgi:hypothetical protein